MNIQTNYDIVVAIIAGSLLFFLLCVFIVAFSALFLRKKQQYKIEKQNLQSQFAETLLKSQLEIKEQTLQHIAYELHDNLGQIASIIKINLNTLRLDDLAKAEEKIEDTKELVRQLIGDLKSLSVSLSSNRITSLGIVKSIEIEIQKLNKTGQFNAVLEAEEPLPVLEANVTIIVFRMVQEILNNIVKHSQAKHITLSFRATGKFFTLVCTDDGVGFNLDEKMHGEGSGLLNLKARAKLINGQLSIQSSPNLGTIISIQLPV